MTNPKKTRIAVLCSGGGSNLQALIDATACGEIYGEIALVIADRKSAYALERARLAGIPGIFLSHRQWAEGFDPEMLRLLREAQIELIVLAGYLSRVGESVVEAYRGRMMNIHPALLPAFGGSGMYGHFVHEAVLAYGAKLSGATVHFVDAQYDHGPVIAQRAVLVLPDDDAQALAARVLTVEHELLPACVRDFCAKKIRVDGRHVCVVQ